MAIINNAPQNSMMQTAMTTSVKLPCGVSKTALEDKTGGTKCSMHNILRDDNSDNKAVFGLAKINYHKYKWPANNPTTQMDLEKLCL